MADKLRPLFVFAGLAAVIAVIVLVHRWSEGGRPLLLEVRVVTASKTDPVYRDGVRRLAAGEPYTATVALLVEQRGRGRRWVSPAERLALGGERIDHERVDAWPERDRTARVLWLTVEPQLLGGELDDPSRAPNLEMDTFAAPEMGRGLVAEAMAEPHNDDHLPVAAQPGASGPGTLRLAARVEIVAEANDIAALQAVTSPADRAAAEDGVTSVRRRAALPAPLDGRAGELFHLPSFERPDREAPPTPDDPLVDPARRRLACSSPILAAVAVHGDPVLEPGSLRPVADLSLRAGKIRLNGAPPLWGATVRPADILRHGGHWIVLLEDDGDGRLGADDPVLHAWGRPPELVPLSEALPSTAATLELLRYDR